MSSKFSFFTIISLIIILPFFFLPITLNFFTTNKLALISLILIINLITFAIYTWKHHRLNWKSASNYLPLFNFLAVIILNLILISNARYEALINQGFLYFSLTLLAFFISTNHLNRSSLKWFIYGLIFSGTLMAIYSILQILILHQLSFLPQYMQTQLFTPTGSLLVTLTFLALTFVLTFVASLKQHQPVYKTLLFIVTGIQLAALVAYLTLIYQGTIHFDLLPYQAGWSIALDTLKSPKNLLIGVGLANFPNVFTQFKPLYLNQTQFWNLIPSTSSTFFLQLLTTTGLLGFLSFVLFLITTLKLSQRLPQTPEHTLLKTIFITTVVIIIFLPSNLVLTTILFISAALIANQANSEPKTISLHPQISYLISISSLILGLALAYGTYRVYAAEYYMRQAQIALTKQDAKATYDNHLQALKLMPYLAAYHTSLSQIDLNLASAISQKQNLTDKDKQQITSLIQQAIAEAKTAVQLQPNNAGLWQNLALIYRNLINTAQNADQFALQYYTQALKLDPANPFLRLRYGGLFYQLAQTTKDPQTQQQLLNQAIQQFQTAIQLRPTYANAYYNLAKTYELLNNIPAAYQAMQQVIANLKPDSPDYNLAKEELKKLEEKLPKKQQSQKQETQTKPQPKELSQPSPLPSPLPTNNSLNLQQ